MHEVGANAMGRISGDDFEALVACEVAKTRRPSRLPPALRRTWKRAKEAHFARRGVRRRRIEPTARKNAQVPRERYRNTLADRRALLRPLGTPFGVEWGPLVRADAFDFRLGLDQLKDAELVRASALGRHSLLHYLAQAGDVAKLRDVMARPCARDIVARENAAGQTALDYAAAAGAAACVEMLSCYHQEHLAVHHIQRATARTLRSRGFHDTAGKRCRRGS